MLTGHGNGARPGQETAMTAVARDSLTFTLQYSSATVPAARRAALLADPGFGRVFTDHMVTISWTRDQGWHDAMLRPYGPLSLDPASAVLHYGQEIFEGLKAYRQRSGSVVTFRPAANAARFRASAARMAMPELAPETFLQALELLVSTDQAWVPANGEHSLYLRPFMIATQVGLGIGAPSSSYLFCLIASPAGAYFHGGGQPVTVWLARSYTRAAPGGTGAAKTGGNYAASFAGQLEALGHGCEQVVWLDAAEHRFVEEMGGMNLFFVYGSGAAARLVTPPCGGTLLPGVTRDSLLTLAPDLGIPAEEGAISVEEWQRGCASGAITEVFACGTAAVITPVGAVREPAGGWRIGTGAAGPVTARLRRELLGIQFGELPDRYGWIHKIC